MLTTPETVVLFEPMSPERWRATYQATIRVLLDWLRIRILRAGVHLLAPDEAVYVPRYRGGDYIDGKPDLVRPGDRLALVRLPALALPSGSFFLLDGLHRMTELRPRLVVLDWIRVAKGSHRYFWDLRNPTLARHLEAP